MNFKHAQYVLTIVQEGSFTAAAKKLYLSQPSLSQTIKQLETSLGIPIFNRASGTLKLTHAGKRYVECARQIMRIYENLLLEIEDMKTEVYGKLRLGVTMQRGMRILPQVIPLFVEKYPHVEINLFEFGSDKLESMVEEGICDIALVTTSPKVNHLEYTLIRNELLVLMASKTTAFAQKYAEGMQINIADAADENFVALKPGHSVRVLQDRLFSRYRISPRILVESDSFETAKQIAARSNAVMITPSVYIDTVPELRAMVKCYPIQHDDAERHFYLCYRKGMHVTRYMRDLLTMVQEKTSTLFPDIWSETNTSNEETAIPPADFSPLQS